MIVTNYVAFFCASVANQYFRCLAADRRAQFEKLSYTEADYQEELRHIEEVCKNCSVVDDSVLISLY